MAKLASLSLEAALSSPIILENILLTESVFKDCFKYQQCSNEKIDCDNSCDFVYCMGSRSCYDSNIYNFSTIYCYGDSSCINATIKIEGSTNTIVDSTYYSDFRCGGYSSCYNITS